MRLLICAAYLLSAIASRAQETPTDLKSLLDRANAAHMKGDYEGARQALVNAWDLAQQLPPPDPIR